MYIYMIVLHAQYPAFLHVIQRVYHHMYGWGGLWIQRTCISF